MNILLRHLLMPLAGTMALIATAQSTPPYRNRALPVETRIADLLARMRPEEKFDQLFMVPGDLGSDPSHFRSGLFGLQVDAGAQGDAGGQLLHYGTGTDALLLLEKINGLQRRFMEESRLGIPMLAFDEALHGLVRQGATAFPQAIGMAATFDTVLMARAARAIAMETRARGIRMVLSPVVNLATDPRWGRVEETYGEDPLLVSSFGLAYVQAMERNSIVATPKHFVLNHGDGGRDSYPVFPSERLLRERYLKPFRTVVQQGGARSIMTAYNSLDGRPCSANDRLLNGVLRSEWGFRGFVISDASATGGANVLHLTARDYADAGRQSMENGQDVIFQTDIAHTALFMQPFMDGQVAQAVIDSAVARVLRVKLQLGLFDSPYTGDAALNELDMDQHRQLAYEMAVKGAVLLKNEGNALPLASNLGRIAVIGEDAMFPRLGGYSGPGNDPVALWDGLRERLDGRAKLEYATGCTRTEPTHRAVPSTALFHTQGSQRLAGLQGTYYNGIDLNGKPAFTRIDGPIDFQWTLSGPDPRVAADHFAVKWEGLIVPDSSGSWRIGIEGNDGYRLYLDGTLLIDRWEEQGHGTQLAGQRFEQGIARTLCIEYRERSGQARFKLVWDKGLRPELGEARLQRAVDLAAVCDAAIIVAGIEEGEFRDRSSLRLPGRQEELILRVAATGKPVIVVLVGGSAITMDAWIEEVDAVLMAWYPGEAGGLAMADLLMGTRNPSGKLPITFPRNEGQLPLIYNHYPTGRGDDYVDGTGQPLFPFGYGLSYSRFAYGGLALSADHFTTTDTVDLTFTLTNTGTVAGEEVVQLYAHDELASIARPVKELKGFQRVALGPGETKQVRFHLHASLFSFPDGTMQEVTEPGLFRIMVGSSSKDIRLRTPVEYRR